MPSRRSSFIRAPTLALGGRRVGGATLPRPTFARLLYAPVLPLFLLVFPPFSPPAPRPVARLRSSACQLLWRGLTSPARSSPATAPRLPDAIRRRTRAPDEQEISRFPREELEPMPGSLTAPGRNRPRGFATLRIAFRPWNAVGTRDDKSFAGQWLAYASPCRRFAADLAVDSARARGRCGAQNLHRRGLSPHAPRPSPGALQAFSAQFQGFSKRNPKRSKDFHG